MCKRQSCRYPRREHELSLQLHECIRKGLQVRDKTGMDDERYTPIQGWTSTYQERRCTGYRTNWRERLLYLDNLGRAWRYYV